MIDGIFGLGAAAFLLFCRLGSCVMLLPGYGSARVPGQVRLMIALALSASLVPLLHGTISPALRDLDDVQRLLIVINEVLTGVTIGLMGRSFLLALQFSATLMVNTIGLAGIPGQPMDDAEALPALATLLSVAAVALLMASGLHVEVLRAVVDSYAALPIGPDFDAGAIVDRLLATLRDTYLLALRLASPFAVYGVAVNVALGLANRFAPQISIYFPLMGAVTIGGLLLLQVLGADYLTVFLDAYRSWIVNGR